MLTSAEQLVENRKAFEAMFAYINKFRENQAVLSSNFEMKSPTPEVGKWYVAAPCEHCGKLAPFFEDASKGEVGLPPEDHFIRTDCVHCRKQTKAYPSSLISVEWNG